MHAQDNKTVLWDNIKWSEMGKQNIQAKMLYKLQQPLTTTKQLLATTQFRFFFLSFNFLCCFHCIEFVVLHKI